MFHRLELRVWGLGFVVQGFRTDDVDPLDSEPKYRKKTPQF